VIRATTTNAARSVFLRACSALQAADWDGQEAVLQALDSEGWAVVSKLALQHGLLGLVGRNLDWAHQRTGVPIPIRLNVFDIAATAAAEHGIGAEVHELSAVRRTHLRELMWQ
jgi:hypothetical protein